MSDTLSYIYKPRAVSMTLAAVFFAACAATLVMAARENQAGLVINGLITLDAPQATLFYWVLSGLSVVMSLAGVLGLTRAITSASSLMLNEDVIRLPKSAFSSNLISVPYGRIRDLERQQVNNQQFLVIHHTGGKISVTASMLPNRAAFDEVCRLVTERALQAREAGR